ncbi:MAG TPA: adenylate/guanylate cyclase domain-containing protein [Candidatus Limnocylindrales bacterium]|nr:adenylate/guanylate cyclase domain-containing protein [Candidatus Limnocylindrales bacterium]
MDAELGGGASPVARPDLPTGTVTFLFTDIEGSTRLAFDVGVRYDALLATHHALVRESLARHGGVEVSTEGDAFFAVFSSATRAIAAALAAQQALAAHPWPADATVRVRMGLHTGDGRLGGDNYVGTDVNRAARIAGAGHGGQVLLSDATRAVAASSLPPGVALRDLGIHRLKDLPEPERIWQLDVAGLPSDFPVIRSLDARPNNLPLPSATLIGRTEELAAAIDLVGEHRLVTMTGPGGTGKTRLVLAVAHHVVGDLPDGAFFVALQDARDRPAVAAAIASALDVREKHDRDLEQGVKDFVSARNLLLVLDNFEQVVGPGAPLVAELLALAPALRIVVTSRAALRLTFEQEFAVPPLAVPDPRRLPPLGALGRFEAIALFVQRARAVAPGFAITDDNARAVAEICSRLDGLPLAIELAAARVKVLDPAAILDRLERRLPVLATAARDAPARQRTLHAAIDWSYDLLEPSERGLFARLAVFAGGWTLEAAEEVCNATGDLDIDILDGIASLADKSLLRAVQLGPADDPPTASRFTMLQVIREFAAGKLDAQPDADAVHRRHAEWVLALAEEAQPELRRTDLRRWQHRLRREEENLRTALRWALDRGEAAIGLRTAAAVWDFWHYWAEVREGIDWLEALLALPAAAGPTDDRARGLDALAGLLYWQGKPERAMDLYEEAVAIRRGLGDEHGLADALWQTAWAAAASYQVDLALDRARQAQELYARTGDETNERMVADWILVEPVIVGTGGDPRAAVEDIQRAFEMTEMLGRAHDAADWLGGRAMVHRMIGDPEGGLPIARASIRTWHQLGNLGRLPLAFKLTAALELQAGQPRRAVRLEAAARRLSEDVGGDLFQVFGQLGDPIEEARGLLDPEEHARAVEEGRSLSLDEQVAYAIALGDG